MTDDGRTDEALLSATAGGDDAAFAVLVRRYVRGATLLATQLLAGQHGAEDVTQDAFVVVHRNARKFDPTRPFAPWFFAIVRRLAANRRSRELRRARLLRLWGWIGRREPASRHPEDMWNARLDAGAALRAMDDLPSMQRGCFDLVAVRGFSTQDVAAMYGISESTVRQHVFRARAALRAQLSNADREES